MKEKNRLAKAKQWIDELLQRDKVTDRKLEKVYNRGAKDLKQALQAFFARYEQDKPLNLQKMRGKVDKDDLELLRNLYRSLPKDMTAPAKQRAKLYTYQAGKDKGGVLHAVNGLSLLKTALKAFKILQNNNENAVNDELQRQKKNVKKSVFSKLKDKAKELLKPSYVPKPSKQNPKPVSMEKRFWLNHDQMLAEIDQTIKTELAKGQTPEQLAEKLFPGTAESNRDNGMQEKYVKATWQQKRLARTESALRADEMIEDSFNLSGIKYYDWVDERGACDKCGALANGSPYPVNGANSPRPVIDSHPNCRCIRVAANPPKRNEVSTDVEFEIIPPKKADNTAKEPKKPIIIEQPLTELGYSEANEPKQLGYSEAKALQHDEPKGIGHNEPAKLEYTEPAKDNEAKTSPQPESTANDKPAQPETVEFQGKQVSLTNEFGKPYSYIDLSTNSAAAFEVIRLRFERVLADFKRETGIDLRESIKNGTFSVKGKGLGSVGELDDKGKFLNWLYHRVGYDALPKKVDKLPANKRFNMEYSGGKTTYTNIHGETIDMVNKPTEFYRGLKENEGLSPEEQIKQLFTGKLVISIAGSSDWGRGIYVSQDEYTAKRYTRKKDENGKQGKYFVFGVTAEDPKVLATPYTPINQKLSAYDMDYRVKWLGLPVPVKNKVARNSDKHYDIIAVLAGYDIIQLNEACANKNIMNRGILRWTTTKPCQVKKR